MLAQIFSVLNNKPTAIAGTKSPVLRAPDSVPVLTIWTLDR
jgi:hypothetical protein